MHLRILARSYVNENDFDPLYSEHLMRTVRYLCDYCGRELDSLEYDVVNSWLSSLLGRVSKTTVANYRRQLITLWNYGADLGLWDYPTTRRIKRIRVKSPPPNALSPQEVRMLIDAAGQLVGEYSPGVLRADYWQAVIIGGYDIGARRGDIWSLPRSIIDGKQFVYCCAKEGRLHCRRLSDEGCERLARLASCDLAYPWFRSATAWAKAMKRIGRIAGFCWQFRQLRKTHGSLAGTLGHASQAVFTKYYFDPSLSPGYATGPAALS